MPLTMRSTGLESPVDKDRAGPYALVLIALRLLELRLGLVERVGA
jgi:hypothetical protein